MTRVVPIPLLVSPAYLLLGDEPILVDTGSDGDQERILAALDREGVAPRDLKLLLHTHGHSDHCGGSARLRALSGAPTAIHVADAEMLQGGFNRPLAATGWGGRFLLPFLEQHYPRCDVDIAFAAEFDLRPYGIAGQVVATPGHTRGSVSVLLGSGDALIGDLLMGGPFNGWLLANWPVTHFFAEEASLIRPSLQRLLTHRPRRLFLGHGGPLETEHVRAAFALDD